MIKFESNQWTARISEEFTFDNVRKVSQAIADKLPKDKPLIIGYDARFLSDQFAIESTKVILANGIRVFLTEMDTPAPVVAWEVKDKQAAGAIMITGGDQPAEYSGISFIRGSAPAFELQISESIPGVPGSAGGVEIERFDPRNRYLSYVENAYDFGEIKKAGLKIMVDPMFGSVRGYLDRLLQKLGCRVDEINDYRDVLFGGAAPVIKEENMAELKERVIQAKADLGLAYSADGAAFGLIDRKGNYSAPRFSGDAIIASLEWVLKVARGEL